MAKIYLHGANKADHAGFVENVDMSAPDHPQAPPPPNPYKSESTTLILSIILGLLGLNGIGHIYVGKVLLGITILIGSIILYAVAIIGLFASISLLDFGVSLAGYVAMLAAFFALFIWQIIHSRNLCRKYNEHYRQHGKAPW